MDGSAGAESAAESETSPIMVSRSNWVAAGPTQQRRPPPPDDDWETDDDDDDDEEDRDYQDTGRFVGVGKGKVRPGTPSSSSGADEESDESAGASRSDAGDTGANDSGPRLVFEGGHLVRRPPLSSTPAQPRERQASRRDAEQEARLRAGAMGGPIGPMDRELDDRGFVRVARRFEPGHAGGSRRAGGTNSPAGREDVLGDFVRERRRERAVPVEKVAGSRRRRRSRSLSRTSSSGRTSRAMDRRHEGPGRGKGRSFAGPSRSATARRSEESDESRYIDPQRAEVIAQYAAEAQRAEALLAQVRREAAEVGRRAREVQAMNDAIRDAHRDRDGNRRRRPAEQERRREQPATPEPSDDGSDNDDGRRGRKRKAGGSKKKKDKRRKRQRKSKKRKSSRRGRGRDDDPDDSSSSSRGSSSSDDSSDDGDSDASDDDSDAGAAGGSGSRNKSDKHMDAVFQRASKVVGKFEEGGDVSTFIMIFEKESAELTPQLKMQLLRGALVPSAVNFYRDIVDKHPEADGGWSVDKWLRKLRSTYEPDKRQRRAALLERKQAAGEDATTYVRDVVRLCRAYNKDMDDLEMVSHIVNNIHPDYRREVQRIGVIADQSVSKIERALRNTMALMQTDGAGTYGRHHNTRVRRR